MSERAVPARRAAALTVAVPVALVAVAAAGWWWSARMAAEMAGGDAMGAMGAMDSMAMPGHVMSLGAFLVAWVAMMAAMMFPAVSPVVRLYARAAAQDRVAPLPFFVAGYIAVWSAIGLPAYFAWRALLEPLDDGAAWAGRLAGAALLVAAAWQVTPLKAMCLRHCRSPLSFFMRFGSTLRRPVGALRMGATHGLFCLGCCWALMVVLVAFGTMQLAWMALLAALIFLEKNAPRGELVARAGAVALACGAVVLLVDPSLVHRVT